MPAHVFLHSGAERMLLICVYFSRRGTGCPVHCSGAAAESRDDLRMPAEEHTSDGGDGGPGHCPWMPLHLLRQPVPSAVLQLRHSHR